MNKKKGLSITGKQKVAGWTYLFPAIWKDCFTY